MKERKEKKKKRNQKDFLPDPSTSYSLHHFEELREWVQPEAFANK